MDDLTRRLGQLLDQVDVLVDELEDAAKGRSPSVARSLKVAADLAREVRLQVKMTALEDDEGDL